MNKEGIIQWKVTLDGKPKSDMYEVDYLKNNKFNTYSIQKVVFT